MSAQFAPFDPVDTSIGLLILRVDTHVFNFTTQAWDTLPPSDVPTPANPFKLARATDPTNGAITADPLLQNCFGGLPHAAMTTDNTHVCVVALDSGGNIIEQIDGYPLYYW
jgi:hypothetical protein